MLQPIAVTLLFKRGADHLAGETVSPAMIRAGKRAGVAKISAANLHTAMAARVQKRFERTIALAADQYRVGAHVSAEVVAGIPELTFVREKEPRAREDAFELKLVDSGIGEDRAVDNTALGVDHSRKVFDRHRITSTKCRSFRSSDENFTIIAVRTTAKPRKSLIFLPIPGDKQGWDAYLVFTGFLRAMSNKHEPHSDGKEHHGQARSDRHHDHAPEPIKLTPADETHSEAANESAPPEETIETLRAQLADKDREIAELKDKYLRALADFENSRKRIRQQSEESVRLQRESLLRDLLPIVDNLERAVEAARGGGNGKPIVEGVQMVLASLLDYLRVQGVTPIEAKGRMFDPRLHEAVDHVESPHHEPNTVVDEMHRGYAAGDRILRPARVSVSKGRSGEVDPERKQGEE